jgi:hypothetical protein
MKRRRFIDWRSPSFLPPYSTTSIVGKPVAGLPGVFGESEELIA